MIEMSFTFNNNNNEIDDSGNTLLLDTSFMLKV